MSQMTGHYEDWLPLEFVSTYDKQESDARAGLRFLPDSPGQIAASMERLGPVRDQLYRAFEEAVARVNEGQQMREQPAAHRSNSSVFPALFYDFPELGF